MRNLVITGFMGTGKSTVGRAVAQTLGLTFVDMDEVIAERAGMSVAEIFARQGEQAFRDMERALAVELGQRSSTVIATGGGTMLRPENRTALGANALVVCLACSLDVLLRRLSGDGSRPLLAEGDKLDRMRALLEERSPVYASLPVQVDTSGQSVAAVTESVLHRYRDEECRPSTLP